MDSKKKRVYLFLLLFIFGASIRIADVWRPIDGSVREIWRECDIGAVAKNFYQEGMNIFYPRIDWRGDGPGYAEMEFPIFSWLTAVLYKIFGYNEILGRLLSYFFSLLTLVVFFALSRYLLSPFGAVIASAFFVLSPLVVRVSNALQPEGLMFFCYLCGAYFFIRWMDEENWNLYILSLTATSLMILAKANAAHIGLFFLMYLIHKKGLGELRKAWIWVFGVVALLPSVLWYAHAHKFWLEYGNSLGVSNEYHWVGLDLFTNPRFLLGLGQIEVVHIWMPLGILIGCFTIWFCRSKDVTKLSLFWLVSLFVYYIVTIRTTSENWATYYHVVSIPPAALLIGEGMNFVRDKIKGKKHFVLAIVLSLVLTVIFILIRIIGIFDLNFLFSSLLTLVCSLLIVIIFWGLLKVSNRQEKLKPIQADLSPLWANFLLFSLVSTFLFQGFRISIDLFPDYFKKAYGCALSYKPYVPDRTLILVSGGSMRDEDGYPLAFNASHMFFWLERKGFSIAQEEQSVEKVREFIKRGAQFFVVDGGAIADNPDFLQKLRREFILLKECNGSYLFRLVLE